MTRLSRTYGVPFLFAGLLVIQSACHSGPAEEVDPDRMDPRTADSLRGAQAQRSKSSATQAIEFTADQRNKFNRVEQMIQAYFAGVQVTPSGGGYSIRVRGANSFGGNNEPLIVIDGAARGTGDLASMNPREVQRIELMKDGAASIYGSRGSNGVIRITTVRSSP